MASFPPPAGETPALSPPPPKLPGVGEAGVPLGAAGVPLGGAGLPLGAPGTPLPGTPLPGTPLPGTPLPGVPLTPGVPLAAALPGAQASPQANALLGKSVLPGGDLLPQPKPPDRQGALAWAVELVVNWLLLLLAVANLALVFFDATYIELRGNYLRYVPALVTLYDPVKGVEPHRRTAAYLVDADHAFDLLNAADARDPAAPAGKELDATLARLRDASEAMVKDDPFVVANMSGLFETIKRRFREDMGIPSAHAAMSKFWTRENLSPERLQVQETFFQKKIGPLVARNYYRSIGENGHPTDNFYRLDLCFVAFFVLEFVIRAVVGLRSRRYPSFKALCLERWYDLLYFIPLAGYVVPVFQVAALQLVRGISVGYRMQRLGLINPMEVIQARVGASMNVVADLVQVKLLTNYQETIQRFDLQSAATALSPSQRADLRRVIERNMAMFVAEVLPEITPALEAVATRTVKQALEASPAYQSLKRLPFLGGLPEKYLPAIVEEVFVGSQKSMLRAIQDPELTRLTEAAIEKIVVTVLAEMQKAGSEEEIKALAIGMLEEQKQRLLA